MELILTNGVSEFIEQITVDSIKSLNENNYSTINDLMNHIYEIINEFYRALYNKKIGKYHLDYIKLIIHKVIHNYFDKEWFEKSSFNWMEDYNKHNFHLVDQAKSEKINRLKVLNKKPKQVQGTQEWLSIRQTCLTASNITNIINKRNLNYIILDKCGYNKLSFPSGNAIMHGKKYEDVAVLIYENRTNLKVYSDYGCIPHEDFSFIAASPDGIDELGNVIEIKCVYSRKITGLPKEDYYDQMQLQMEVFKLYKCYFLECEIKEYETFKDYKKDVYVDENDNVNELKNSKNMEKGVIFKIVTKNPNNPIKYIYPENLKMNHSQVKEWVKQQKTILKQSDPNKLTYKNYEPLYWKLTDISCITIYKDHNWIYRHFLTFHDFWKDVCRYKNNPDLLNDFIQEYEEKQLSRKTKHEKIQAEIENNYLLDDSSDED